MLAPGVSHAMSMEPAIRANSCLHEFFSPFLKIILAIPCLNILQLFRHVNNIIEGKCLQRSLRAGQLLT